MSLRLAASAFAKRSRPSTSSSFARVRVSAQLNHSTLVPATPLQVATWRLAHGGSSPRPWISRGSQSKPSAVLQDRH